ncbi:DNA repair protein XRCC1 [Pelodytes ibericus]
MPEIKLKHVVSCSSADATHKAENLLKSDAFHKWRSRQVGEKQVSVILQFEKEEQIHGIDIGNECSAFVEVLVGHSTSASELEYEVILATSSFMSPSESKSEKNRNRLRMFGPDKLVKGAAEKKWDRAKIVCTQPYNKNMAYGLSFIRFNSPPNKDDPSPSDSPKVTKLGQFKVKEEDDSSMRPGSLFFSRTSKPQDTPPKVPQSAPSYASLALQGGSSSSTESSPSSEKQTPKTPHNSNAPKEPSSGKRKFEFSTTSHPPAKKPDVKEAPSRPKESASQPAPKKAKAEPSTALSIKKPSPPEKTSHKKSPPASQPVEMGRILQGTVFVLSGFQNPFRSDLRDKALELGAKYRPDWTPDSTHLICAFANTPKYGQVKAAGGIIVRKEWVLDCYRKQQRLPYKKYLMASADSSSEEDDDSEDDSPPRHKAPRTNPDAGRTNHKNTGPKPVKDKPSKAPVNEDDSEDEKPKPMETKANHSPKEEDKYGGSTDEENTAIGKRPETSGSDTEDDLVGGDVEKKAVKKEPGTPPAEDPYAGSTDENTDVEEAPEQDCPIPELPDLFIGKRFFLYGEFPTAERRTLQRYITAFNGELEEYMNEKVQFVITLQEWDDSFEDALNDNSNLSFVRPRWIYNCNERQKCIPHQPYVVVPQSLACEMLERDGLAVLRNSALRILDVHFVKVLPKSSGNKNVLTELIKRSVEENRYVTHTAGSLHDNGPWWNSLGLLVRLLYLSISLGQLQPVDSVGVVALALDQLRILWERISESENGTRLTAGAARKDQHSIELSVYPTNTWCKESVRHSSVELLATCESQTFETTIPSSGTFDTTIQGSGTFNTTIQGSGTFYTTIQGSGTFYTTIQGSGTFYTTIQGSGTFNTTIQGSGTFDIMIQGAGTFDTTIQSSGTFDTMTQGSGTFDTMIQGSGTFDTMTQGSGTFDTMIQGSGTFDTMIHGSPTINTTIQDFGTFYTPNYNDNLNNA